MFLSLRGKVPEAGLTGELDVILFTARFVKPLPAISGPFLKFAYLETQVYEVKLFFCIQAFREIDLPRAIFKI